MSSLKKAHGDKAATLKKTPLAELRLSSVSARSPQDGGSILAPPLRGDFRQRGIGSLVWGRACRGVWLYLFPHQF